MDTYKKANLTITAFGYEVTGSMNVIHFKFNGKDVRIIVDCGLVQSAGDEEKNFELNLSKEELDDVVAIIITHGHVDHCGMLTKYVAAGYSGPIFTSNTTRRILSHCLPDTIKVQNEYAWHNGFCDFGSNMDIFNTLMQVKNLDYFERTCIYDGVFVTLIPNAHIPGASMVLLEIMIPSCYMKSDHLLDSINLLFTGDLGFNNPFIDNVEVPDNILSKPLSIICESTYGDSDTFEVSEKFENDILRYAGKKRIIIPVCALNKAQIILYNLKEISEKHKLPQIYYDGPLSHRYTKDYPFYEEVKQDMKDFLPSGVVFVNKNIRDNVLKDKSAILVTTSGMGTNGPSKMYIENTIGDPNTIIYFTSYCAEGTLGRELLDNEAEVAIVGGAWRTKIAKVMSTDEFSSHAKRNQILAFLKQFKDIKTIFLNHGDVEVKNKFKTYLQDNGLSNIYILGKNMYRVGPYGVIRRVNTRV